MGKAPEQLSLAKRNGDCVPTEVKAFGGGDSNTLNVITIHIYVSMSFSIK
jgi:hypothetical protein